MTKNGGEFQGTTKEAISDLKEDVKDLQVEIKSINHRINIILILLTIAIIERVPTILSLVMAK